ncbi:F5/8 type C domain-containing protein, partial [Clostridium cavendishii DSM 21758]
MKKRLFLKRIVATLSTFTFVTSLVVTSGVNVMAAENEVSSEGYTSLGDIKDVKTDGNKVDISVNPEKVQVTFLKDDVFRIWMDPKGEFKDPTQEKIIAKKDYKGVEPKVEDKGEYYKIATESTVLRAYKKPLKFAMYDKDDKKEIWKEKEPLKYNGQATEQTLDNKDDEDFYGCGVQNGYFSHKNKDMHIGLKISHWNDGSVSNPVPFYMSTAGYGVFRNTFEAGDYSFKKTGIMKHDENRFDAFYFAGDLKKTMNSYTELTGRPSLLPRWGFGVGDADCYNTQNPSYTGDKNKPGKVTTTDVLNVTKKYRDLDMPGGWILPNDGYGCGYENLDKVVQEAGKQGFKVGLWTQNGVDKIKEEVGKIGTRVCKLDVAWVGPGYEYGLDATKSAYEGIENNSDSRGFVWAVCGWAGTQRYSTVWTGDQTGGNFEYIRFHIPSVIGGGLSGMPYVSSDTDGIFGGKAKTYTRDLQWKTFIPTMINMSGWAQKDKQPWIYGEPYTSINRKYLKLRQALTPYMYTTAAESYKTGAPIDRAMVWEYPNDPITRGKDTQYQFMLGENLLVAPIYEGNEDDITKPDIRNGIYFPKDTRWIDFWTGKQYQGGKFLNGYEADINTLPVFVKAGAIIPMYPEANYDGEKMPGDKYPLTLNVYPYGHSEYTLYEDDGNTKEHRSGKYATTKIQVSAPTEGTDKAIIRVNETQGSYKGMAEYRKHEFVVHTKVDPEKVAIKLANSDTCDLDGNCGQGELKKVANKEEWEKTACCSWYFDPNEQGGVVRIKTKATAVNQPLQIELDKFNNDVEKADESLVTPDVPQNVALTDIKDNEISVKWDAVQNATSYDIMVDGAIYENVKSPYVHKGLDPVTKHSYKVRAVNKTKVGEWSNEIAGETQEDRNKNSVNPEELSATANSEQPGEDAFKAVDGDLGSLWHTDWFKKENKYELKVDIAKPYDINKIIYYPRDKGGNGVWRNINLYASTDGKNYTKIFENLELQDTGLPHELKFETVKGAKSFKVEILKGNGGFASAVELQFFKANGEVVAPEEDVTADKKVDINDLNFMVNYYRVKQGDNDWNYVSKGDFNKDNLIGIFDVAKVASKIEPKLASSGKQVAGNLYAKYDKEDVKAGDQVTVQLYGDNLADVYAFESIIP